jgi:hypothetical protein
MILSTTFHFCFLSQCLRCKLPNYSLGLSKYSLGNVEATALLNHKNVFEVDGKLTLYTRLNDKVDSTLSPFVNRKKEMREIAFHNANFVLAFQESDCFSIMNYRAYSFCFAPQMYGAGKTRIGQELQKSLKKVDLDEELKSFVDPADIPKIKNIIDHFCCGDLVRFDLMACETFSSAAERICGELCVNQADKDMQRSWEASFFSILTNVEDFQQPTFEI